MGRKQITSARGAEVKLSSYQILFFATTDRLSGRAIIVGIIVDAGAVEFEEVRALFVI